MRPALDVAIYVQRLRNDPLRAYAEAYWTWLRDGQHSPAPHETGVARMAAQTVRYAILDLIARAKK